MKETDQLVEKGRVVSIAKKNEVWLETLRQSTCYNCEVKSGCGQSLLSGWLDGRINQLKVFTDIPLKVGDEVEVGIAPASVAIGALWQYGLPLILLIVCSALGQWLTSTANLSEAWVPIFGGMGLCLGFITLKYKDIEVHGASNYQPVVLRKISGADEQFINLK